MCARESRETLDRLAPYILPAEFKRDSVQKVGVKCVPRVQRGEVQLVRVTVVSESRSPVYRC